MIQQVEVMRGGGSALFGGSAIAGTINIITKEPLRNSAMLSHTITGIGGFNSFDNNTSDAGKFDTLVSLLVNGGRGEFACYRSIKW